MSRIGLDTPNSAKPTWPLSLPQQTALQESIHDRYWDRREKIILALDDSHDPWSQRRAIRMAHCCNGASFFVDPDVGQVKPWISRCHVRDCPYCARSRTGRVAAQLLAVLHTMKAPRVFVLTVKSVDRPLADQLRALRHAFAKVRRRAMWKKLVTGGAYTVEITLNLDTLLWHPHLHIIWHGTYFPQKLLRNLWHEATGGAEIVWVEAVRDYHDAARELTKYIGAPQDVMKWPAAKIRDYARAVNGARMVQCFGDCHGVKVEDRDDPDTESPSTYQVKISRLVHLAYRGAESPQRLLVLIAERWPQFRSYIYHQLPKLELPISKLERIRRMFHNAQGRGPPPDSQAATDLAREQQDRQIFMAFTRFKTDDEAGVFYSTDFPN